MSETKCNMCDWFAKKSRGETVPYWGETVYESEHFLATHSTKPFAEAHVFIGSKAHIPTIFDLTEGDNELVLDMMNAVKAAAKEVISLKGAAKLEMYLGDFQKGEHIHCHIIYDSSDKE
ncbi:MAG: HIT domain-containing protein [Defluviitaleaceae bacterium]|nr:HIT domain-containing protein [Defluviitaleaceae bacterium]